MSGRHEMKFGTVNTKCILFSDTAIALFALSFASLGIKQTSSAPVDTSRYDATRDANVTNSSSAATLDEVDTGSEEYRQTALKARSALLHLKRNAALQFRNLVSYKCH